MENEEGLGKNGFATATVGRNPGGKHQTQGRKGGLGDQTGGPGNPLYFNCPSSPNLGGWTHLIPKI